MNAVIIVISRNWINGCLSKHSLAKDKFSKQALARYKFVMEAVIILALVEETELIDTFANIPVL